MLDPENPVVLGEELTATAETADCVLASAAPEELSLAPPGAPDTAFSGELLRLLHECDPTGPPRRSGPCPLRQRSPARARTE